MYDENYWKEMASRRRLENKALKARIVEIIEGREKWKKKAKKSQEENAELKKRINEIKKKHQQDKILIKRAKPKSSHYSITIISLVLRTKLLTSCRFRAISNFLPIVLLSLSIDLKDIKTPSRTCAMLWVKKLGYYCLTVKKEKADDWVLVFDESIGIGKETLLLILGIRRSEIDFTRPLQTQDMTVLVLKSKESWTGEEIAKEIAYCKQMLGGIIYATTDGSSTLKKALRLSDIPHVYDVTHAIAVILEKIYKKEATFKRLTKKMNNMRSQLCCGQYAHIIPPNQRSKSRYLNLEIISQWCSKVINILDNKEIKPAERELLSWVGKLKRFIKEMENIMLTVKKVSILLKHNGLNQKTYKECLEILKSSSIKKKQKIFNSLFIEYLDNNMTKRASQKETLMCTSDIIETIFGRYKNELNQNPMNGITDMALIIAAMTSKLSEEEIMAAIDNCTTKQISEWQKNNLCDSLSVKRNEFYNIDKQIEG